MKPIAGVLILGLWLADLAHLYLGSSLWPAAGLAWSAALLLGPRLDAAARRQCFVLYLAALLLLALAAWCCSRCLRIPRLPGSPHTRLGIRIVTNRRWI